MHQDHDRSGSSSKASYLATVIEVAKTEGAQANLIAGMHVKQLACILELGIIQISLRSFASGPGGSQYRDQSSSDVSATVQRKIM